jgi:hypothetical protein
MAPLAVVIVAVLDAQSTVSIEPWTVRISGVWRAARSVYLVQKASANFCEDRARGWPIKWSTRCQYRCRYRS